MAHSASKLALGALTTTGSPHRRRQAAEGIIGGKPIQFRGQNAVNLLIFLGMTGSFIAFWLHPDRWSPSSTPCSALRLVFGVMLVIPIGSADMPVVMSLLNALYAGLAAAATGFVLGNNVLIIAGTSSTVSSGTTSSPS